MDLIQSEEIKNQSLNQNWSEHLKTKQKLKRKISRVNAWWENARVEIDLHVGGRGNKKARKYMCM